MQRTLNKNLQSPYLPSLHSLRKCMGSKNYSCPPPAESWESQFTIISVFNKLQFPGFVEDAMDFKCVLNLEIVDTNCFLGTFHGAILWASYLGHFHGVGSSIWEAWQFKFYHAIVHSLD